MKSLIILFALLFVTSCSDRDDQIVRENIDKSIAPKEIIGNWKVDYYKMFNDIYESPGSNNYGFYVNFDSDNTTSFKDVKGERIKGAAKFTVGNDVVFISLDGVEIDARPSKIKSGYTEFRFHYPGKSEYDNILYAKK